MIKREKEKQQWITDHLKFRSRLERDLEEAGFFDWLVKSYFLIDCRESLEVTNAWLQGRWERLDRIGKILKKFDEYEDEDTESERESERGVKRFVTNC